MNILSYDYLVSARRRVDHARGPAGRILSQPLMDGARFHCIKDLVMT